MTRTASLWMEEVQRQRPDVTVAHVHHSQDGIRGDGYHKLAQHFGWALGGIFDTSKPARDVLSRAYTSQLSHDEVPQFGRTIILEDDLLVVEGRVEQQHAATGCGYCLRLQLRQMVPLVQKVLHFSVQPSK